MEFTDFQSIVRYATDKEASDIHLLPGQPPIFRVHGDLSAIDSPPLSPERLEKLLMDMLSEEQRNMFLENKELDYSHQSVDENQLRINIHYSEGCIAAAIRITPGVLKPFTELNLHPIVQQLAHTKKGIIFLSGTAGSGKSTTMNCIMDLINQQRKCKLITIEDPIEFHHKSKKSYFIQREVGIDTASFSNALKYALRQDPDVVCIGEIRDLESMRIALTTAETGHLVITTVHASDAVGTLNRIVSIFPMGFRDEILSQLASNLVAVIYQTLLPRKDSARRILATEIMLGTMAVKNLIRRNDFKEIRGLLDANETDGMFSLEVCLAELYKKGLISYDTAYENANYRHCNKLKEALFSKDKKLKFLIMDSHVDDIKSAANILMKTYDCEISYSENGREGLTMMEEEQPDVVLLNTQLKDMSGFDVSKQIRGANGAKFKLIMFADSYLPEDPDEAKSVGADEFVIKTHDYRLLLDAINKVFAT